MPQTWFEMPEIRKRFFDKSVWIPLREARTLLKEGKLGHAGFKDEFWGAGSIAVPLGQVSEAEKLEWMNVGIGHSTKGYVDEEEYIPAHSYKNRNGSLTAENLVLVREGNAIECSEWHLSPDFIVTLELKREEDDWLAISRGYEKVARLERNSKGCPISIQVNAKYLKDYLCARGMGLYISSYRSRVQVMEDASHINWPDPHIVTTKTDRWEGRNIEIHEGGHPFGSGISYFHLSRTDVDYDEDVPEIGFPGDDDVEATAWQKNFEGRKLFRVEGELWRNEWVNPAEHSYIVCDEETEPSSFFITNNSGKTENRRTLVDGSRWLWFKPSIINSLLDFRGSCLRWYTRDTGSIECSPGYGVHFGINKIGLVNVYAKDIALLPDWQQKIWAGHNVTPDGKVSEELLMSQMKAKPASTIAPEKMLLRSIQILNGLSLDKYRIEVIREHPEARRISTKIHRFRAVNQDGLYELAKDLYRLTGERIDSTEIKAIVTPKKKEEWGSLKSLEKLLAVQIGDEKSYELFTPLWGIYTLRNADTHLPSEDLSKAYKDCNVDRKQPLITQGYQLIQSCVSCLNEISKAIKSI